MSDRQTQLEAAFRVEDYLIAHPDWDASDGLTRDDLITLIEAARQRPQSITGGSGVSTGDGR